MLFVKIVLAAAKREETAELRLMAIGSYAHMICRRSEAAGIFFPLNYLPSMDAMTEAGLQKISALAGVTVGVGYRQNGAYAYAIFENGAKKSFSCERLHSFALEGREFRLSMGEIPLEGETPLLYFHDHEEELTPEECPGAYELYDLGPCREGIYEAIVFQNGKIKCRLLPERPSFLMKSVPDGKNP